MKVVKFWLFAVLALLVATSAMAAADKGRVIYLRGMVTATDNTGVPRILRQDSRVAAGEEIATSPKAVVQLVFPDGSMLQLKAESTVVIEEYRFNPKDPDADKAAFKVLKGSMRSLTGFMGKRNPDSVEYKTPLATIGIRGTAVEIGTDGKGGDFANFDFGSGTVTSGGQQQQVQNGKSLTLGADGPQMSELIRPANDPAKLAVQFVNSEKAQLMEDLGAVCADLEASQALLMVAMQGQVPGFESEDLLASIEGLVACLGGDVSSNMLTLGAVVYPEDAENLLGPAVRGGFNVAIALDSVLRGMENADSETQQKVLVNAVKQGITMDQARRVLTGLRDEGICR